MAGHDAQLIDLEQRRAATHGRGGDRSHVAGDARTCEVLGTASGTIVQFNPVRGYGFIEQDDGGDDVFLHWAELRESGLTAHVGARVSFTVLQSPRGLKARDVEALDVPAPVIDAGRDSARRLELLSTTDYSSVVTDALVEISPTVTASQIVEIAQRLVVHAYQRGWLVDQAPAREE